MPKNETTTIVAVQKVNSYPPLGIEAGQVVDGYIRGIPSCVLVKTQETVWDVKSTSYECQYLNKTARGI